MGPAATVPLLDAGARSAVNRQARAAFEEAAANYRKTTLTAYQEVEDNLAGLHHLADELQADLGRCELGAELRLSCGSAL